MAYVLIVDDEEAVCLVIRRIIQAEGHECEIATGLEEAKEFLGRKSFDLVTLDIRMPNGSGLELLDFIGLEYPGTAVVMVTYIEDPNVAKLTLEKGAYGYISKPFDREEVIITIHGALKRRQAELANQKYQDDLQSIIISRTQELVESEAKYRDLVQSVNSVIMRLNSDGLITFFNDYGLHFFGYKASELIGKPVIGTVTPECDSSGKNLGSFIESLIKEPESFYYNENENIKKNGEIVWMAWTNRLIINSNNVTEILSVGTDITAKRHADEIVKASEEHLRFILDSIAGGIMIIDAENHNITYVNSTASEIIGLSKEEIIGHECHRFVCPAERRKCPYTDLGENVDNSDRIIIDSTGKQVPILKTILPMYPFRGQFFSL